jgi:hypothetical protein
MKLSRLKLLEFAGFHWLVQTGAVGGLDSGTAVARAN